MCSYICTSINKKKNMKKSFATVLVWLALAGFTFATEKENPTSAEMTTSVTGTVIDKTSGEVLAGVAVKVVGTDLVVYSDLDGNFQINNLKPGKYQIESDMISYKKNNEIINLELKKDNKIEVELENL